MEEKFGRDYFYGKKSSNYSDYSKINPSKQFKNVVSFLEGEKLKGRFLDVGCAFGLLLKEVSRLPFDLYGCDISQFAIKIAKKNAPLAELNAIDLEKPLPYQDGFFDCITALDVLEHTKNFKANFENIVKKIKKGGFFIISLPINSWPRKLFGHLDKDKTHISILKMREIMDIARKNKLTIIRKRHFCPFPFFYKIPWIPAEAEIIFKK